MNNSLRDKKDPPVANDSNNSIASAISPNATNTSNDMLLSHEEGFRAVSNYKQTQEDLYNQYGSQNKFMPSFDKRNLSKDVRDTDGRSSSHTFDKNISEQYNMQSCSWNVGANHRVKDDASISSFNSPLGRSIRNNQIEKGNNTTARGYIGNNPPNSTYEQGRASNEEDPNRYNIRDLDPEWRAEDLDPEFRYGANPCKNQSGEQNHPFQEENVGFGNSGPGFGGNFGIRGWIDAPVHKKNQQLYSDRGTKATRDYGGLDGSNNSLQDNIHGRPVLDKRIDYSKGGIGGNQAHCWDEGKDCKNSFAIKGDSNQIVNQQCVPVRQDYDKRQSMYTETGPNPTESFKNWESSNETMTSVGYPNKSSSQQISTHFYGPNTGMSVNQRDKLSYSQKHEPKKETIENRQRLSNSHGFPCNSKPPPPPSIDGSFPTNIAYSQKREFSTSNVDNERLASSQPAYTYSPKQPTPQVSTAGLPPNPNFNYTNTSRQQQNLYATPPPLSLNSNCGETQNIIQMYQTPPLKAQAVPEGVFSPANHQFPQPPPPRQFSNLPFHNVPPNIPPPLNKVPQFHQHKPKEIPMPTQIQPQIPNVFRSAELPVSMENILSTPPRPPTSSKNSPITKTVDSSNFETSQPQSEKAINVPINRAGNGSSAESSTITPSASAPDYSALVQYIQNYQQQMSTSNNGGPIMKNPPN